jgi:hypothetical protein
MIFVLASIDRYPLILQLRSYQWLHGAILFLESPWGRRTGTEEFSLKVNGFSVYCIEQIGIISGFFSNKSCE